MMKNTSGNKKSSDLQSEKQDSKDRSKMDSSYEKQRKRSVTANELNPSQQSSRGNKTPHIPGLDFGKLNTKKIEIDPS